MKLCKVCNIEKEESFFRPKHCQCKECENKINRERKVLKKEQYSIRKKEYYYENQEKNIEDAKQYRLNNIEAYRERDKKYYYENREKKLADNARRKKERMKTDPEFKLKTCLRIRTRKAFKTGYPKSKKTLELIGCPWEQLKIHIENQFVEGMTWENYGLYVWHIDHIIPLCAAKTLDELEKLCHYTNLQPLWAEDNLKKSGKIPETYEII